MRYLCARDFPARGIKSWRVLLPCRHSALVELIVDDAVQTDVRFGGARGKAAVEAAVEAGAVRNWSLPQ